MSVEIERKFLVKNDSWKGQAMGVLYRQGYLAKKGCTVRVRVHGDSAKLTIKGARVGLSRSEFEYAIPRADAEAMLSEFADGKIIEKIRYKIPYGDLVLEVDEFLGENLGLVMVEVELPNEDFEFEKPDWFGMEVSGDDKYYNSNLVKKPYSKWKKIDGRVVKNLLGKVRGG